MQEVEITDNPAIDVKCDVSNIQYNQLVLSMLQEKKCIQIPTKVVSDFVKLLEKENISFRFVKNEKFPHWTTIHQLYCNCEKKCNHLQNGYCENNEHCRYKIHVSNSNNYKCSIL